MTEFRFQYSSNLNMDLVSLSVISLGWSLTNVPNMAKMIQAAEWVQYGIFINHWLDFFTRGVIYYIILDISPQILSHSIKNDRLRLTHWGRVTHICVSKLTTILVQISHFPNQCWRIVNWTPGNKLQWNFSQNSYIFIQENALQNVTCEMAVVLSPHQCVFNLERRQVTSQNTGCSLSFLLYICAFDVSYITL